MKVKIALALVVTVALALYFWPGRLPKETVPEHSTMDAEPPQTDAPEAAPMLPEVQEDEADVRRRAELEAAYAGLETARRDLRRHLDGLKSRIWGMEFQPGQAREISRDLHQGYSLLSNPPLMGAFGSAAEIEAEKAKIEAMRVRLAEVEKLIEEAGGK